MKQKDKQLHFFAMLALCMTLIYLGVNLYITLGIAVVFALLWEVKDYYLIRKDFGSRANEVKYDWPDVLAFLAGIAATFLIVTIKKLI